jgi:N-hydroxyarylamine O-acetyltransferase
VPQVVLRGAVRVGAVRVGAVRVDTDTTRAQTAWTLMNLDAYFARIAYEGAPAGDARTLHDLHRAHALAIPFENLDIQMGRSIDLALPRLEDKLVRQGRGGYCFEQNSLLLGALRALGFEVMACEARVFDDPAAVAPRTHMLLVVSLDGGRWLCDVGFGGDTPLEPVPLHGVVVSQGGGDYRVAKTRSGFVLQADLGGGGWRDQYAFEMEPREAIDFEVAHWYTSTHPASRFVRTLTAQSRTATGSKVLRNLEWVERRGHEVERRTIQRPDLESTLAIEFGLRVPDGARFRALDAALEG